MDLILEMEKTRYAGYEKRRPDIRLWTVSLFWRTPGSREKAGRKKIRYRGKKNVTRTPVRVKLILRDFLIPFQVLPDLKGDF